MSTPEIAPKNSPTLWEKASQSVQSVAKLLSIDPQERKVTLATQEQLIAYQHEEVKAAFDPSQSLRPLEHSVTQMIWHTEKRSQLSLKAQFLQGVRRSQEKQASTDWTVHTQDQMRSSARIHEVWSGRGSFIGFALGQVVPSLVIREELFNVAKRIPKVGELAKGFLPQGAAQVEEARKSFKSGFAQVPANFCMQQGQTAKALGEAEQLGYQSKSDKASKEADSAAGAKSEIKQDETRLLEATMAALRTSSEIDQRIAATGSN